MAELVKTLLKQKGIGVSAGEGSGLFYQQTEGVRKWEWGERAGRQRRESLLPV